MLKDTKERNYKIASFFAGIGGIDIGFKTKNSKTIYMNEKDQNAVETLRENFDNKIIVHEDIKNLKINEIPKMDILLAGFPCQSFSLAGYRRGFEDKNGELYFDVFKIIKAKKPRIVFLENVKNLVAHDNGNTFDVILNSLESIGYKVKYQVMNSMEYGNVTQNRERIYVVGFLEKEDYKNFRFPEKIKLTKTIKDFIDFENKVDEKYYYDKFLHYEKLVEAMKNKNTVYQWRRHYVRENKKNVSPTLTANMGTGGHNVPLVNTDSGIRKLTPRECINLQGFPKDYKLPNLANSHLYKQAGNSVVVPVIKRIAKEIYIAMEKSDKNI